MIGSAQLGHRDTQPGSIVLGSVPDQIEADTYGEVELIDRAANQLVITEQPAWALRVVDREYGLLTIIDRPEDEY